MLDHDGEAFEVAMDLIGSFTRGKSDKLESLRPQIRKSVENLTRWKQSRGQHMAAHYFGQIVNWMLGKGREDSDARSAALALAKALANIEDHSGERFMKPVIPMLLSSFPEIAWPLIGQAIVSDRQRAWHVEHVLGEPTSFWQESFGQEKDPALLRLPEDTLFAWCHAHPDRAPAFVAGVVPVLTTYRLDIPQRSLHPVMVRLLDEFGDRGGVLEAITRNIRTFGWSGPLTNYFALYDEPLKTLRNHPKPKVRRWATATLRGLASTIENAHAEEEEREARWET